jgi:SagB-type dehydrogenase family enzyme
VTDHIQVQSHTEEPLVEMAETGRDDSTPGLLLPDIPGALARIFHANTKQQRRDYRFYEWIALVNASPAFQAMTAAAGKNYQGRPTVTLPKALPRKKVTLDRSLLRRRSTHHFGERSLPLSAIARVLAYAFGITGRLQCHKDQLLLRAAPSAGALYPLEAYLVAFQVNHLSKGVYHYNSRRHELILISETPDVETTLGQATGLTEEMHSASAVIVITAMFRRCLFKYGDRGYRFILIETGHVAQNVLLVASSLRIGTLPVGGFIDDEVNNLLEINGVDEAALYAVVLGPKHAGRS